MDQLENFRKMLSGVEKSPVKEEVAVEPEKTAAAPAKKPAKVKEVKEKGCTIWVSQSFRKRLKRLCFWFSENGGMEEPTQMKILEEALDFYLKEKFPAAEK